MSDRDPHDSDRRGQGTQAFGSRDAEPDAAGAPEPGEREVRPVVPGVEEAGEPSDEDEDLVGTVIDERYRITGFLGRGAMGSVYRAEHVTIRRPVALKLLHASLVSVPEISARFEREAFAIGRIDHPNCVGVSDFGKLEDGSLYLALELVHGRPLADVLESEGRLEPRRALHITRHVLRGLAHAHREGIVHRDVKPGNVVLTERDGDHDFAKILDFGIAKLEGQAQTVAGGEKLTQAGIACGTPAYMSPEQVVGDSADPRSDLYAAGIMLFELIAGRPPFFSDDDHVAILTMHTSSPPPTLAEIAPEVDVPLGVETIVRRALAKQRGDRFASAEAMIEAIDGCLGGSLGESPGAGANGAAREEEAARPRPGSDPGRRRKTSRVRAEAATVLAGRARRAIASSRSPARAGALAVAAVALVGALGWWFFIRDRGPSPAAQAAAERLERGDPAGALAVLDRDGDAIDRDPHAQLQRGHAHAARRERGPAVESYERALELRGALKDDPVLQTNLELFLDAGEPEVALAAAELLIRELGDARAAERLAELASSAERAELRQGALALAEDLQIDDAVDRTRSVSLDLAQADACEDRREAVAKLRALGDPAAVPALRGVSRREDDTGCAQEDAAEAIRYLEALERRTRADAAPPTDG
jgi:eukaryotic-like serine/threonine-protein kinase